MRQDQEDRRSHLMGLGFGSQWPKNIISTKSHFFKNYIFSQMPLRNILPFNAINKWNSHLDNLREEGVYKWHLTVKITNFLTKNKEIACTSKFKPHEESMSCSNLLKISFYIFVMIYILYGMWHTIYFIINIRSWLGCLERSYDCLESIATYYYIYNRQLSYLQVSSSASSNFSLIGIISRSSKS